jgi:predicted CoA-binding protein
MAGINDPGEIARALKTARTIAVVGCSPKDNRPSHAIASYLLSQGFDVIPVNPGHPEILGLRCYPDLASIPKDVRIDIVDVFRRSEFVSGIADAALSRGVGFFWMQDGVVDDEAARRLAAAGIPVAMDRCIYRDHAAL